MENPWTEELGKEGAPAVEREFAQIYKETPRYVFSDAVLTVPEGVTLVRRKDAIISGHRMVSGGPSATAGITHVAWLPPEAVVDRSASSAASALVPGFVNAAGRS